MTLRLSCAHRGAFAVVVAAILASSGPLAHVAPPDHLVVMVFDQMRPDYVDRFDLANFKRLRSSSRHYPDAYVGHLGSQTVVAHAVIPTGLKPGALPWQDEAMVDLGGVLGKPGAAYKTGDLSRAQLLRFLETLPRSQFLAARVRDTLGGGVFAVGTKNYATVLLGGPHANAIVTLEKAGPNCVPQGVNVPAYLSQDTRFTVDCSETYGSGFPTIYALDGSHYVPGRDAAHQGGDVWTADAAIAIMRHEPWSAMFLTFGGIDKVAHMLGEQDGDGLQSVRSEYRLADVLRTADAQLGRVLAAVNDLGLTERTAVVVTADHGGQRNEYYLGNSRYQSCCPFEGSSSSQAPYWLEHLTQIGKLKTGYADTSITLWLAERSAENEAAVTRGLTDVSGVTEIYAKRVGGPTIRYERVFSRLESQSRKFQIWARQHSAELVDTMAGPSSPDLVALLGDRFGFGRIGGHGGAQELVQRIPLMISVPGERPSTRRETLRLMDIASQVDRILGLRAAATPPR
jgi:hypothetical protein